MVVRINYYISIIYLYEHSMEMIDKISTVYETKPTVVGRDN